MAWCKIRVGISHEKSQEIVFRKAYRCVGYDDIRKAIGDGKEILGWVKLDGE